MTENKKSHNFNNEDTTMKNLDLKETASMYYATRRSMKSYSNKQPSLDTAAVTLNANQVYTNVSHSRYDQLQHQDNPVS